MCLGKRGHVVTLLLTVESQVIVFMLEYMTVKGGKGRSMLCSDQGVYIMPAGGMHVSHEDVFVGDAICKSLWEECWCYCLLVQLQVPVDM
jgi:hypothetical protein